ELLGVANGAVGHERQSRHAGDGGGIVGLQCRAKFRDEVIEFLLQGGGGDDFLRRLGEGGSELRKSGCEQKPRQNLHGSILLFVHPAGPHLHDSWRAPRIDHVASMRACTTGGADGSASAMARAWRSAVMAAAASASFAACTIASGSPA